jgi:N-acetylmuramoyl-L-alanine amidase
VKIIEKLLTVNQYSRPGRPLGEVRGIILHNGGIAGQRAPVIYNYFNDDCPRLKHYSSSQYGIDIDGTVYRWVPDNEVAYHCGTENPDPASGRVYTDWARSVFGRYAADYKINSPNNASIGIEMCILDTQGNFDPRTLQAARELVAALCRRYAVPLDRIGTHNMVVGWKACPLLWAKHPGLFEEFSESVRDLVA